MHPIVRSSIAGLLATGFMSVVVVAGRYTGLLGTPPPKVITARMEQEAGILHKLPYPVFQSSWMAAHLGYGIVCGALYGLARRWLPRAEVPGGLLFGGLVWAVSYLGLMPGLQLYPWPSEDTRSRQGVMIAAHAVFGIALALIDQRLRDRALGRGYTG